MRKIKLDVDALAVDTFAPVEGAGADAGTVEAMGSGVGCMSLGCDSISDDGQCNCENEFTSWSDCTNPCG